MSIHNNILFFYLKGSLKVSEYEVTLDEVITASKEGRLHEMFGTGTACMILPIVRIFFEGKFIELPRASPADSLAARVRDELMDIQVCLI